MDEVNPDSREDVEKEIEALAVHEAQYRIILTCRTADYKKAFSRVQPYTILPLSDSQISSFARRWLGPSRSMEFVETVRANPYGGAEVVPLTLAHLCAIYERDGELPPRPVDVYEMIVSLAVEDWDRQRGVTRHSRYSDFSARKRERFLQGLAFHLTIAGRRGSFSESDLERAYELVADQFGLPAHECAPVIAELESHTGLVQQTGFGRYEFVHLVIQEHLTAMYAGRMVNVVKHLVPLYPDEMALVVASAASPEDMLEEVVLKVLPSDGLPPVGFVVGFLARLGIEAPHIQPSARNGWVVLGFLGALAEYMPGTVLGAYPPEVVQFLASEQVRRSVLWAAAEAEVFDEGPMLRLVPHPHSSMPPALGDRWRVRREAGFRVVRASGVFKRLRAT